MADISKIKVNNVQVNLKDSLGRQMVEQKQKKLTAGEGIYISEDNTIHCTTQWYHLYRNTASTSGVVPRWFLISDTSLANGEGAVYWTCVEDIFSPDFTWGSKHTKTVTVTSDTEVEIMNFPLVLYKKYYISMP